MCHSLNMDISNQTSQAQQPINQTFTPDRGSSKSKFIPIILSVAIVAIIAIGAYALGTKQTQAPVQKVVSSTPLPTESSAKTESQDPLGKVDDCGIDLDCFIKFAKICNPATVSLPISMPKRYFSGGNRDALTTLAYTIIGQESGKCVLKTEDYLSDDTAKKLLSAGKTQEDIIQIEKMISEMKKAENKNIGICGFDIDDLVSTIEDIKKGQNTFYAKASECNNAQENDNKRKSDVNTILMAVYQYMADNKGVLPNGITSTDQEISNAGANICSSIVPLYTSVLPVNPKTKTNKVPIYAADCTDAAGYRIGYNTVRDSENNRITVSAPTEQGLPITATR